jgi:hypothetical protein
MLIDKVHMHHIMLYEFRRGTTATQTVKNICEVYGEGAVKITLCQIWFDKFRSGDFGLDDSVRTGRLKVIDEDELQAIIASNYWITTLELAVEMNVSQTCIVEALHHLGMVTKLDVWVPHALTEETN